MELCDETDARALSRALTGHARDIHRYASAFCVHSQANREVSARQRKRFAGNVWRMVEGMRALLLLARYKGISRYCNLEQIEAWMEGAASVLEDGNWNETAITNPELAG